LPPGVVGVAVTGRRREAGRPLAALALIFGLTQDLPMQYPPNGASARDGGRGLVEMSATPRGRGRISRGRELIGSRRARRAIEHAGAGYAPGFTSYLSPATVLLDVRIQNMRSVAFRGHGSINRVRKRIQAFRLFLLR
jgi:hypothetical protein